MERGLYLALGVEGFLRVASINMNGMSVERTRKEILKNFKRGKLHMVGIQEIYKGCGAGKCVKEIECEM